jgi:hypothetical protein
MSYELTQALTVLIVFMFVVLASCVALFMVRR